MAPAVGEKFAPAAPTSAAIANAMTQRFIAPPLSAEPRGYNPYGGTCNSVAAARARGLWRDLRRYRHHPEGACVQGAGVRGTVRARPARDRPPRRARESRHPTARQASHPKRLRAKVAALAMS